MFHTYVVSKAAMAEEVERPDQLIIDEPDAYLWDTYEIRSMQNEDDSRWVRVYRGTTTREFLDALGLDDEIGRLYLLPGLNPPIRIGYRAVPSWNGNILPFDWPVIWNTDAPMLPEAEQSGGFLATHPDNPISMIMASRKRYLGDEFKYVFGIDWSEVGEPETTAARLEMIPRITIPSPGVSDECPILGLPYTWSTEGDNDLRPIVVCANHHLISTQAAINILRMPGQYGGKCPLCATAILPDIEPFETPGAYLEAKAAHLFVANLGGRRRRAQTFAMSRSLFSRRVL